MEIKFTKINGIIIAEIISDDVLVREVQDAVDLLAECSYGGSDRVILQDKNLSSDFYELKTKLAGEILQKFSNYRMKLAVTGDYRKYTSKSLQDFIRESNRHGRVIFTADREEAIRKFSE